MTQAEIIDQLIDSGLSYEEVLEQSESKPSYVKGRFTKKGLDWKAVEESEEEPVVEEKREEGSEEVSETPEASGTEDAVEVSGDLEDEVDLSKLDSVPSLNCGATHARAEKFKKGLETLPTVRRARTGKYIDMVLDILGNQDFCSQKQSAMNCRYMMISPRPTRMNFYKEIFHIQNEMKEIFRKSRK